MATDDVSPELALVSPELSESERGRLPERPWGGGARSRFARRARVLWSSAARVELWKGAHTRAESDRGCASHHRGTPAATISRSRSSECSRTAGSCSPGSETPSQQFLALVLVAASLVGLSLPPVASVRGRPVPGHAARNRSRELARCCQAIRDLNLRDNLQTIVARTIVVVGADESSTPVEHAEAIVRGIPVSRLLVIPDAAHLVTVERADAVNDAVLEHLAVAA
jgi:pimeloyl-ACP methyl ester carboxylesterase